ncbi:MAG: ATP-binding cassette domain-containing protein [Alphaproteobacteria bacterium]|nr:ATP-binding cassette domain-containing protein [Alphaproteobacteria bacterium]
MLRVDDLHRPGLGPLSFHIDEGECLALTGPSGAGKSLLLRAIVDLDPNQGRITAAARPRDSVPAPEWRRLVAYLPAESGWWMDRVGDHMPDGQAARELLDGLGFADPDAVLSGLVGQLSSGERQRLALARGLLGTARVLLLDEPTSALDPENCALVEALLRARLAAGVSVLLVSHDVAQVARLAARGLRLEQGQLVAGS